MRQLAIQLHREGLPQYPMRDFFRVFIPLDTGERTPIIENARRVCNYERGVPTEPTQEPGSRRKRP